MSQTEYLFENIEQLPYKPGFERFTYTFSKINPDGSKDKLEYQLRISDTLIGQWDLEEVDVLKKAMFVYLTKKYLSNDQSEEIELNAYQTPSPNQFPFKSELDEVEFPPKEKIVLNN